MKSSHRRSGVRGWLRKAVLPALLGLGLLGGVASSQLLVGCACSGGETSTQGNGITPIPIPGCAAELRDRDGGFGEDRPQSGGDAAPSPDAISPDLRPPPDGGPPPPSDVSVGSDAPAPADGGSPDAGPPEDAGADLAIDATPDGADLPVVDGGDGGGDTGDLTPDATDAAPADAADLPPADLTGAG